MWLRNTILSLFLLRLAFFARYAWGRKISFDFMRKHAIECETHKKSQPRTLNRERLGDSQEDHESFWNFSLPLYGRCGNRIAIILSPSSTISTRCKINNLAKEHQLSVEIPKAFDRRTINDRFLNERSHPNICQFFVLFSWRFIDRSEWLVIKLKKKSLILEAVNDSWSWWKHRHANSFWR